MTTQQAISYEQAIIDSGMEWVNGESTIDGVEELAILAGNYGVRLPACMYHFVRSDNPNHVSATGAHKTIIKVLDRLKNAILR